MYVAITRARKRLYLSFSQTRMLHGQTRYNVKSRFFDELPEATLKWLTPRNQGFGSGFAREYQNAWQRGSGLGSIVGAGRVEAAAGEQLPVEPEDDHLARPAHRPECLPHQVRRRRDRHARGQRRGRPGPGQLRPARHEVAGAVGGQAHAGELRGCQRTRDDRSSRCLDQSLVWTSRMRPLRGSTCNGSGTAPCSCPPRVRRRPGRAAAPDRSRRAACAASRSRR